MKINQSGVEGSVSTKRNETVTLDFKTHFDLCRKKYADHKGQAPPAVR